MKVLIQKSIGADGGSVVIGVDGGDLVIEERYPVAKLLAPIEVKIADRLKALIPGDIDDKIIDAGMADLASMLSEAPVAPAAPVVPSGS